MAKPPKRRQATAAGRGIPLPTEKEAKAFLASTAFSLVLGLTTSALQLAGVISMGVAHFLLFLAWTVAAVSFFWLPAKKYSRRWRWTMVIAVSLVFLLLDSWMVRERAELDRAAVHRAAVPKGSMHYKETEIPKEHPLDAIGPGKQFVVNLLFTNPGPGRVFDVLFFSQAYMERADEQASQRVKALFGNDLAAVLAKKTQGPEISPREIAWRTVRTPPLTQQQYEGILKGTTRLYIVAWLRWTDANGYEDPPLYRCVQLQGNSLPTARLAEDLVWQGCGG